MSLLSVLEIFISLVFAWLVLSIAVMYAQEWLGARLRWRSKMLEAHIRNFLADPALADQFYEHPLIKSLHTGDNPDTLRRPSYIPARMFSLALFDILIHAGKKSSILQYEIQKLRTSIAQLGKDDKARAEAQFRLVLAAARKAVNSQAGEAALESAVQGVKAELAKLGSLNPLLQEAVTQVSDQVEITTRQVDDILAGLEAERKHAGGLEGEPAALDQLREGIAALGATNPRLQQILESLLFGLSGYVEKGETVLGMARQSVENWFDNGTERLSGWYKRHSQKVSLALGLIVAFIFNADTLALTQIMWQEPVVRQAIAAQAETFIQQNEDGLLPLGAQELSALQLQFSSLNVPIGWIGSPLPAESGGGVYLPDGSQKRCTLQPQTMIDYYGLRVGNQCYPIINAPQLNDLPGILLKLFGLLVSGIAAAQGAPFWFDVLKKTVNIRTSGVNPSEPKG